LRVEHDTIFKLMGLHYAQFPEEMEAHDGTPVTGLSGMTCVIPAWRVLDVLNMPELVQRREEMTKAMEEENRKKPRPEKKTKKKPSPPPPEGDRERFKRLLGAAVKPPKSSD
jgi:hypothetical protein